jgi:putative phosphoesterase
MQIAILSDTHDRQDNILAALELLAGRDLAAVLHCGDIEEPATVRLFAGLPMHFVFGNCDSDRAGLRRAIAAIGGQLHEDFGHLELAGRTIAFTHGDNARLLRELEASGAYDFLFHGHTHVAGQRQSGRTRVINPGALHRARPKQFALLELESGLLQALSLPAS